MEIQGTHNVILVMLSVLVAVVASYTALDLAGRIKSAESGAARRAWLAGAAFAMGGGVWSMHFVAMVAYDLGGHQVSYDVGTTALSLVIAVAATAVGFATAVSRRAGTLPVVAAALFMGSGIAGMHYVGMAAMHAGATMVHDAFWTSAAVATAVAASGAALWLARHGGWTGRGLAFAAVVMGIAVSGMHYAAMRGTRFVMDGSPGRHHPDAFSADATLLGLGVAAVTFSILCAALAASAFDRRMARMALTRADALRHGEERFRTQYRRAPLPLHILDAQGRIEDASDAWLALFGYARDEVVGRDIWDFLDPASAEEADAHWERLKAGEAIAEVDYRMCTKDGRTLDVLLSGRPELDAAGNFLRLMGGVMDVTARRQAEAALLQAQKTEAIGRLTGGVAHDFNNLLAVVLGNLDLLSRRLPDGSREEALVLNAAEAARRGASLTQRMLSFARRQELKGSAADLTEVAAGMEDLLVRSLGPSYEIVRDVPEGLPPANVDRHQIELAILNLVLNARDAMPEGGRVTVGFTEAPARRRLPKGLQDGHYVCVYVADEGEGMDAETLRRATEPFFTTKGVGKGTGLGLSMVAGLAEQSGGRFVIESAPGRGTRAEVWLPVATEAAAPEPEAAPMAETEGRVLSVLVVDDDALVGMSTESMLEELGHEVVTASSGRQALQVLLDGGTFDVMVTDQAMPGMTGLELIEEARERWPGMAVVVATGYSELPVGSAGICRLSKPFMMRDLERAVFDALGRVPEPEAAGSSGG